MKSKIFIALIAFATLVSCNVQNRSEHEEEEHGPEGLVILNEKQQEALKLELGTFQQRNLTTLVKTNGELEVPPSSIADITAIIGGNVKEIRVFHGDKVKKGQVLAVLEHPDYISLQEKFSEIANKLEFLEKEHNRQKELFENNVGAGKDYQQVKSEFNTAKSRYEGLKSRLLLLNLSPKNVKNGSISNTIRIISPINGYVNEININVGTYVDSKDKLMEVVDNSHIHADFLVFENDVHRIKEGQIVDFTVSNKPGEELSAKIFAIGKEFEANSRAVHIHASLDNMQTGLIPGMYISGHIHTDKNYTQALPDNAIVTEGTKSFIFVLDQEALEEYKEEMEENESNEEEGEEEIEIGEDAMAFKMVEVVTGQTDAGYTEVKLLDSLPENTQIVMNAAYYLLSDLKKGEAGDDD
ncbi:efflux RND transporter periplasmic adaptor subunit [Ancylomarina sp. DW003]|nr:efflux RND transporter periplasmic adaptor subunit [Ancylomarina sp. DW003]MDE5421018.1 efflux RND transporter periplasmic adaptor subunit [Ancylomarina sp. DW003]